MKTTLNPYLNFKDSARQAMEFYKAVFGGELRMSTFKDYHASQNPSEENLIMHAQLDADGMTLMAADTPSHMEYKPAAGFSVSLNGEDEKKLRGYFNGLSAGGTVMQPLQKAPWGDTFGWCRDKFGISWLVNVAAPKK